MVSLTPVDWLVGIGALRFTLTLGIYLAFRAHSSEDSTGVFLAGRRMLWPVVGASMFATNIGAEHLVGLSGDCYRYGLRAGRSKCAFSAWASPPRTYFPITCEKISSRFRSFSS